MDDLEIDDDVFGVDDRRLGKVSAIRECCFGLTSVDGTECCVLPYAIFNIDGQRVTLLCNGSELERYACTEVH